MRISELDATHATAFRDLRLKGLREEPTSFGAAYEQEVQLPFSDFEKNLMQKNRIVFGAFEEERLIGMLTLQMTTQVKQAHIAELMGLYVHDDYRGKGVSKPIMASAIMRARELKCEQIHLTVNIENKIAKSIYTDFGFEIIGMEKEILKIAQNRYIDEYRMALYFNEWKETE